MQPLGGYAIAKHARALAGCALHPACFIHRTRQPSRFNGTCAAALAVQGIEAIESALHSMSDRLDAAEAASSVRVKAAAKKLRTMRERVDQLAAEAGVAPGEFEARLQQLTTAAAVMVSKADALDRKMAESLQVRHTVPRLCPRFIRGSFGLSTAPHGLLARDHALPRQRPMRLCVCKCINVCLR